MDAEVPEVCITQTTPKTPVLASCRPFHVLSTSFTLTFADRHRRAKVLQHEVRVSQDTVQVMQPTGSWVERSSAHKRTSLCGSRGEPFAQRQCPTAWRVVRIGVLDGLWVWTRTGLGIAVHLFSVNMLDFIHPAMGACPG
jgi:hypothetical protein